MIQAVGRQFGSFSCSCGNQWKSAYAWEEMYQECRRCTNEVLPYLLVPLQHSGGSFGQQPHLEELCEMCQKLGRSCKGYTAPATTTTSGEDDKSVMSLSSTLSSDSGATQRGNDDHRTPVASDDEDTFLTDRIHNLTL